VFFAPCSFQKSWLHSASVNLHVSRDDQLLSVVSLTEGEYVIGSGESAQVRIESELLAPEHVRLRIGSGSATVEDAGSGRSTWVGDVALVGVQPLPRGSVLRFGDIQLWIDENRAAETDEVGLTAGRYSVGAVVASGAMGVIRSARESHTGREVAMKQMHPGMDDPSLVARFVQEAQITAHLQHPNVVPVHDVHCAADGERFYTMKMVRGVSLEKLLQLLDQGAEGTVKKLSLDALLTIFQKAGDAVAFAHSKGVFHRDLKPANIMVGEYGEVLVMDWGLAKLGSDAVGTPLANPFELFANAAADATLAGAILGTPHYMAPEQASGEAEAVDARSDVYALGAILYEILTLHPPVEGTSAGDVLQKVRAGNIVPPQARLGNSRLPHLPSGRIPEALAAVAMHALSFSPERRYQRVTELQADIRAYQSGFATSAEGAGAWRQFTLFIRRNKGVAAAAAAGVLLLAIASVIYTLGVIGERDRTQTALAETSIQRQRADDALSRLEETAPLLVAKAREFVAAGKIDEAIKYFGFAMDVAPKDTDIPLELAELLQANDRSAEAIPIFERVLARLSDSTRALDGLAFAKAKLRGNGASRADGTAENVAVLDSDFGQLKEGGATKVFVQANGDLLLSGSFPPPSPGRNTVMVRYNASGSHDNGFLFSLEAFEAAAGGSSQLPQIFSVVADRKGDIHIGGVFLKQYWAGFVGRLRTNGVYESICVLDEQVNAIVPLPDGKLLIGGLFGDGKRAARLAARKESETTKVTYGPKWLARLYPDGKQDPSFATELDGTVGCLARQWDEKVFVGGDFNLVNGTARKRLARLNADGSLDRQFNATANGFVNKAVIQPDGRILVIGDFAEINEVKRGGIARLNANGTLDAAFAPKIGGGKPWCLAMQRDGRILVGGDFTEVNGVSRIGLARLNLDGSLDHTFRPTFKRDPEPPPRGSNQTEAQIKEATTVRVTDIALDRKGQIVICGYFTEVNGKTRKRLARFRPEPI
jgi:uncharacterized delta-60 repeat protein